MIPVNRSRTVCAEKHDKLGWSAGFSFRAQNLVFGVRCHPAEALDELRALLPRLEGEGQEAEVDVLYSFRKGGETRKGTRNYHLVYRDWNRLARTLDYAEARQAFQDIIFTDLVRPEERYKNVFHSGLSARVEDKVVVVVGAEAEHQQLAEAWSARGVPLLSTRVVNLDSQGRVHSCPMLGEDLPEQAPGEVDCLVFLDPEPQNLSPGRAIIRLLGQSGGSDAGHRLTTLTQALQKAQCCSLSLAAALKDPLCLCR